MRIQGSTYINKEAAHRSGERIAFSFGTNWSTYVERVEERHIEAAQRSFVEATGVDSLAGHTFLDAGCGSGLASVVALRLNADRIVSFDIDSASIACTKSLRSRFSRDPGRWTIYQYSLLDTDLPSKIAPASMVYCWGAAHHTGSMWEAIDNVSRCVSKDGMFLLAIYNRTKHSGKWLAIKRFYNASPPAIKKLMLLAFHARSFTNLILHGENPIRYVDRYVHNRGMSYFRDVEDWLGGLPYEYANIEEITAFLTAKGFVLSCVKPASSHGCNEFIFKRSRT